MKRQAHAEHSRGGASRDLMERRHRGQGHSDAARLGGPDTPELALERLRLVVQCMRPGRVRMLLSLEPRQLVLHQALALLPLLQRSRSARSVAATPWARASSRCRSVAANPINTVHVLARTSAPLAHSQRQKKLRRRRRRRSTSSPMASHLGMQMRARTSTSVARYMLGRPLNASEISSLPARVSLMMC